MELAGLYKSRGIMNYPERSVEVETKPELYRCLIILLILNSLQRNNIVATNVPEDCS
ncbi:hypothetical protein XELAEV_18027380mg [Xenopus laevis]|uniref:Uncharacterized protein n=1 Tax=Xenopus laevis TaxID=8355 RepID=A0A974HJX4_XENLA|nr:hypothetical protein XELAEV_18027380mg [Xenopus laevis]